MPYGLRGDAWEATHGGAARVGAESVEQRRSVHSSAEAVHNFNLIINSLNIFNEY